MRAYLMRTIKGYSPFQVAVKPAGQPGQTFCRIRRPDGGLDTHIGTYEEIMDLLKSRCPGGKIAELKEVRP